MVEYGVDLLGEDEVDTVGMENDGGAVRWEESLEHNKGARAKISCGCG